MVEPVREASLFLETCLNAGLRGETGASGKNDVKTVLAEAGLTWPGKSERSDVVASLFFMSRRVALPVFFGIDVDYTTDNASAIVFSLDVDFQETLRRFRKQMKTRRANELVRLAYQVFDDGYTVNETRLAEILEGIESMTSVFDIYLESTDRREPIKNLSLLPIYAPSVSLEKWSSVLRLYFKLDFTDVKMATLYDVRSFSAIFRFSQLHGKARMNDVFGFLAILAAIFYTNSTLRDSFFGLSEDGFNRHQQYCLLHTYSFYGHALNHFLLVTAGRPLRNVSQLVETVQGKLRQLIRLNDSFTGDTSTSPSDQNLQSAMYFVVQSESEIIAQRYKGYPRVKGSPLHNWMTLVDHTRRAKPLLNDFPYNDCAGQCDVAFFKWRLTPYHLAFPWYAPNVHRGILLSGLGARIAAALFTDYVERSGSLRALLIKMNHDCLRAVNPELEASPDHALQAGVAAVRVTSALLVEDASNLSNAGSLTGTERLTGHQVFFILGCYLFCGYHHGERMCNLPLRHSVDFSWVFNCTAGSYMNPSVKCRLHV
ncbi:hypothetical protein HPB48_007956 [Haemaphysalis longicornis]|uniref:Uncharacterized protein n=1 Tax=Haemaphysalis longicornis TaxID=44386 RepID=A0A9J6FN15_HAELO|nr:hypothetical protein HPB48_007956 [Haemaphysalis longicornis]